MSNIIYAIIGGMIGCSILIVGIHNIYKSKWYTFIFLFGVVLTSVLITLPSAISNDYEYVYNQIVLDNDIKSVIYTGKTDSGKKQICI